MKRTVALLVVGIALVLVSVLPLAAQTVQVVATVETDPVPASDDAADDAAIWIHPSDPSLSTIIGTDKSGAGLVVYDLDGREFQYDAAVEPNNVDLRYDFPLGGDRVALVAFSDEMHGSIGVYRVDPATRRVVDVAARELEPAFDVYGSCLFRSPVSGAYYAFVTSSDGEVEQWELFDDGAGRVDGTMVRTFAVGSQSEGCVADDQYADLYVGEENVGIWRYGAEPGDGSDRTLVDSTATGGHLSVDVEGLSIYYTADGRGYLIASSQGANEFVVYDRVTRAYVGTFEVVDGDIDGVSGTDGLDVTNFPLGPGFPEGLFVAQDGYNPDGNQNFKYVPWGSIARAFSPALTIDTAWDPRRVGGGLTNRPPAVDAGPDQLVAFPQEATLAGSVSDDGLPDPPAAVTVRWSQVSGPGTTTFADPASSTTTAAFSAPGTYELELTAEDGELRADDTVTVRVFDPTVEPIRVQVRVQAGSDDAEESASGSVSLSSSDLELVAATSNQTVGVRFARVRVPRGATIVGGYVQFTVDEATTGATSLTIRGQAADHPATFTAAARDINSRPLTAAGVSWSPPQWRTVGWAGRPQRTPDLAPVIQEIVDRPGWSARNAIVLVFTGSGKRVAIAYDGDPAGGPVLRLEYRTEDAQSGLCQSNTRGARTR